MLFPLCLRLTFSALRFVICFLQKYELDRKTNQLGERDYDSIIDQKQSEFFKINQMIKSLNREKDKLDGDLETRTKLETKRTELEAQKKKLNKLSVYKL